MDDEGEEKPELEPLQRPNRETECSQTTRDTYETQVNDKLTQQCNSLQQEINEVIADKDCLQNKQQETGTSIEGKNGNEELPDFCKESEKKVVFQKLEIRPKGDFVEVVNIKSENHDGDVRVVKMSRIVPEENSAANKVSKAVDLAPRQNINDTQRKPKRRVRKMKQLPEYDYDEQESKQTTDDNQSEKSSITVGKPKRAIVGCRQPTQNDVTAEEKGNNKRKYSEADLDPDWDADYEVKEESDPDYTDPIESDQAPSHDTEQSSDSDEDHSELKPRRRKKTKVLHAYLRHYICNTGNCSEKFKTIQELFRHKNQEHKEGICYICSVCKKQFKDIKLSKYLPHLRVNHSDIPCVPLRMVNTEIINSKHQDEGKNSVDLLVCTKCGYQYWDSDDPSHDCKPVGLLYYCPCCQFKSISKTEMTEHIAAQHSGECFDIKNLDKTAKIRLDVDVPSLHIKDDATTCEECDAQFATNEELRLHVDEQHAYYPFACGQCFTCYGQKKSLTHHHVLHRKPQFKCDICQKEFFFRYVLKTHIGTHSTSPLMCEHCGKGFCTNKGLNGHIMSKHAANNKAPCPDKRSDKRSDKKSDKSVASLICDICGKGFSKSRYLLKHVKTHNKTELFKCAVCEKTFSNKQDYNSHKLEHNTVVIPQNLSCNEEDVASKIRRDVDVCVGIRRFEEGHPSGLPYYCNLCKNRFVSVKSINLHIRNRHLQDKDKIFRCHYCDKGFVRRSAFRVHLRQHTNSKPYKCRICGKSYTQVAHVRQHLLSHGKFRFKCKICHKEFAMRASIRNHVLTHCDILPFKCPNDQCNLAYHSLCTLWEHFAVCSNSGGNDVLECGLCHETFCKDRIMLHYQDHENDEHFGCDRCGQTFKTYPKLYFHKESKNHFSDSELQNESNTNSNDIPSTNQTEASAVNGLTMEYLMSQYDYVENNDGTLGLDDNPTDLYKTQSNTTEAVVDNLSEESLAVAQKMTQTSSSVQLRELIMPASRTSGVDIIPNLEIEVVTDNMQELQTTTTEVQRQIQQQKLDSHNYGKTGNLTYYQYVTDINVEEEIVENQVNLTDMRMEDRYDRQTIVKNKNKLARDANVATYTEQDNVMRQSGIKGSNEKELIKIGSQEAKQSGSSMTMEGQYKSDEGVGTLTPSKCSAKSPDLLHRCQLCNCGFVDRVELDEHVMNCDPFPGVKNVKPIQKCDSEQQHITEEVIDKDCIKTEEETDTYIEEKKGNEELLDGESMNVKKDSVRENDHNKPGTYGGEVIVVKTVSVDQFKANSARKHKVKYQISCKDKNKTPKKRTGLVSLLPKPKQFPGVKKDKPTRKCYSIIQQVTEEANDKDSPKTKQGTEASFKEKKGNKELFDGESVIVKELLLQELKLRTKDSVKENKTGKYGGGVVVKKASIEKVEADSATKLHIVIDQATCQNENKTPIKRTGRIRKAKQFPDFEVDVEESNQEPQSSTSKSLKREDYNTCLDIYKEDRKLGQVCIVLVNNCQGNNTACLETKNVPVSEEDRSIELAEENDVVAEENRNNTRKHSEVDLDHDSYDEFEEDISKNESNPGDKEPIESHQAPIHDTKQPPFFVWNNKEVKYDYTKRKINFPYGRHYICKTENCLKRIKTIKELLEHKNQIHKESHRYICSVCKKQFSDMAFYIPHLRMHHSDLPSIPLHMMNTEIINSKHQDEGKNSVDLLVCTKCGYQYWDTDDPSHDCKTTRLLYYCPCCNYTSKCKTEMTEHITGTHHGEYHSMNKNRMRFYENRPQHTDIPNILVEDNTTTCEQCDIQFATNEELKQHVDEKHANYPFACGLCFTLFGTKHSLNSHQTYHRKPLYKCEVCDKEFYRKNRLTLHMMTHSEDQPYQCEHCGNRFCDKTVLKKHIISKHQDNNTASSMDNKEESSLICDICGKGFLMSKYLLKHIKTHNRADLFKCAVCEKTFSNKQDYNNHKLEHNTVVIPQNLSCNEEDVASKIRRDVDVCVGIRRFEEGHPSGLPYYCNLCKSRFVSVKSINLHIRNRHLQDKDKIFRCHYCDKGFVRRSAFRVHLRQHTNSKPYKCRICGKSYTQLAHVRQHLLSHGKFRFKCKICHKEFAVRAGLRNHVLAHCDILPFKCPNDQCKLAYHDLCTLWKHFAECSKSSGNEEVLECGLCHKTFCKDRIMLHYQDHEKDEHFRCDRCGLSFKTYSKLYFHKESKNHFNDSELIKESNPNCNPTPSTNQNECSTISDLSMEDLMSQFDYFEYEDETLRLDDNYTDMHKTKTQSKTTDVVYKPSGKLMAVAEQLTHMASGVQLREMIIPASHTSDVDDIPNIEFEVVTDNVQNVGIQATYMW